jgi:hypothetical protein
MAGEVRLQAGLCLEHRGVARLRPRGAILADPHRKSQNPRSFLTPLPRAICSLEGRQRRRWTWHRVMLWVLALGKENSSSYLLACPSRRSAKLPCLRQEPLQPVQSCQESLSIRGFREAREHPLLPAAGRRGAIRLPRNLLPLPLLCGRTRSLSHLLRRPRPGHLPSGQPACMRPRASSCSASLRQCALLRTCILLLFQAVLPLDTPRAIVLSPLTALRMNLRPDLTRKDLRLVRELARTPLLNLFRAREE